METVAVAHATVDLRRRTLVATIAGLLGLLLVWGAPATAMASAPEMRGEWDLLVESGGKTIKGLSLIEQEANGGGEFSAASTTFEGVIPGTFSGKLGATEASVKLTSQAYGPLLAAEFTSSTMAIDTSTGLSLSGTGTLTENGPGGGSATATVTATRIKTYKEVIEQREREQREAEEREARTNVRGEWTLKIESGSEKVEGIARITAAANTKNEFASNSAVFGGAVPGGFTGTLEGTKAQVTITSRAAGPLPEAEFTSSTIAVASGSNPTSMTGSGTLTLNSTLSIPGATLTATRVRDYTELKSQEKLEAEAQEKAEAEAREKAEAEATAKAEREARERAEHEAKERAEREAREKAEAEARAKAEREAKVASEHKQAPGGTGVKPAQPTSKTIAVTSSGLVSLSLSNPNGLSVKGTVTIAAVTNAHVGAVAVTPHGKKAPAPLGGAKFSIAAHGHATVKIELSKAGRSALAHSKTLTVTATVLTQTSGGTRASKTYRLTLRLATPSHPHH